MAFLMWLRDSIIGSDDLTAHGFCLFWQRGLVAEMVIGNLMIWIAYFIIPLELYFLLRVAEGRQLFLSRGNLTTLMFGAFIFCCGITHAMDIVVIYYPLYWLQAHWLLLTGLVSLLTCATIGFALKSD